MSNLIKFSVPDGMVLRIDESSTGSFYWFEPIVVSSGIDITNRVEFVEGKDYKLDLGNDRFFLVAGYRDTVNNFGFYNDAFTDMINCLPSAKWVEASFDDVSYCFEQECIKRYGEDWENVHLKYDELGGRFFSDLDKSLNITTIYKSLGSWIVYNNNGILYYNGEWNEVIDSIEDLPKSWDELPSVEGWYVNSRSKLSFKEPDTTLSRNKNVFSSEEEARAMLALSQLSQLRKVYRDGWVPDWNNRDVPKFGIMSEGRVLVVTNLFTIKTYLTFQSKEVADLFLERFKCLIEISIPLLGDS